MPFVQRDGDGVVIAVFENRQAFAVDELVADHIEVTQVREQRVAPPDDSRALLARAIKLLAEGKPLPVDLDGKLTALAQESSAELTPELDIPEGSLP